MCEHDFYEQEDWVFYAYLKTILTSIPCERSILQEHLAMAEKLLFWNNAESLIANISSKSGIQSQW